jgi:hypothetical protein
MDVIMQNMTPGKVGSRVHSVTRIVKDNQVKESHIIDPGPIAVHNLENSYNPS